MQYEAFNSKALYKFNEHLTKIGLQRTHIDGAKYDEVRAG